MTGSPGTCPNRSPRRWIEAVHDADYVAEVLSAQVPRDKERRIGFPVTETVARRAQAVPGGTWLSALLALDHGFAANSAGGSHHALAATGAGYCVFNDLAIAAVRLAEEGIVARVAVVDVDVHQGDGTASLLAGRPGIATYSIHAAKNFPVRKAVSTLDVPLPDGVGDDAYLATLEETLVPFLDQVRPDIILYQAGVDPFADDRLGRLSLTLDGLDRRERLVAGHWFAARGTFRSRARSAADMATTRWRSPGGTWPRSSRWGKRWDAERPCSDQPPLATAADHSTLAPGHPGHRGCARNTRSRRKINGHCRP